jgi:hypothetical protein
MANGEPVPKQQKASEASVDPPKDLSLNDIVGMDDG